MAVVRGHLRRSRTAGELALPASAQDLPPKAPTKEQLAKDNKLFIELATKYLKWDQPAELIRIVGHTEYFGMEAKRKRAASEGVNAWVDPEGYRRFVAAKRRAFEDEVDAEMGVAVLARRGLSEARIVVLQQIEELQRYSAANR